MLKEFKEFISRGNVIDLTVGIIVGAAFTSVVKSIVDDLVNPLISLLTGGVDVSNLYIPLTHHIYPTLAAAETAGVAVFAYGRFLMAVFHFLVVAVVLFFLVRMVNRVQRKAKSKKSDDSIKPSKGPTQEELLTEIRDLLKSNKGPIS